MSSSGFPMSDALMDELGRRGDEIYAELRDLVEPAHNNQFIAIHVDSGKSEVARSSGAAMRAVRARHPLDGRLYIRKIGDEPEYGLAARILALKMNAGCRNNALRMERRYAKFECS
jgi:hypothetical protein